MIPTDKSVMDTYTLKRFGPEKGARLIQAMDGMVANMNYMRLLAKAESAQELLGIYFSIKEDEIRKELLNHVTQCLMAFPRQEAWKALEELPLDRFR